MSKKITWNNNWNFTKDAVSISENTTAAGNWETLDLPHTWNGDDGQDGGSDYYRGTCYYAKNLSKAEVAEGKEVYIEFEAANSSAELYVNGTSAVMQESPQKYSLQVPQVRRNWYLQLPMERRLLIQ